MLILLLNFDKMICFFTKAYLTPIIFDFTVQLYNYFLNIVIKTLIMCNYCIINISMYENL